MRQSQLLALFIACSASICLSQYFPNSSSQGASSQNTAPACTDPAQVGSVACSAAQTQRSGVGQGRDSSSGVSTRVLRGSPYADQLAPATPPPNPSQITHSKIPMRPETEFEQMVADSLGRGLPLFGQSLFAQQPSTFSPVDWMLVPSDYIIGPGDELQIKIWG